FTPDCPYLHTDAVFGVKADLIADFKTVDDPQKARELGFPNPFTQVDWTFVLARSDSSGSEVRGPN
ncbi:MAG: 6-chlorohydroxyquinol-1,2-dioxygenase, partial [Methylobacterium sp.]